MIHHETHLSDKSFLRGAFPLDLSGHRIGLLAELIDFLVLLQVHLLCIWIYLGEETFLEVQVGTQQLRLELLEFCVLMQNKSKIELTY